MATFPSKLPKCLREGYSNTPSRRSRRFQMDDGSYRQRRVEDRLQRTIRLLWRMTWPQLQLFEAFLKFDVAQGTGYFDIEIGSAKVTVRPVEAPTYSPLGQKWSVSLNVEFFDVLPTLANMNAVPVWPFDFGFEKDGYSIASEGPTRSDIESGVAEMRQRFREKRFEVTGRVIMSEAEKDQFWEFFRDELINGNRWFKAPIVSARSVEYKLARFVEAPTESTSGAWFSMQMLLETANLPVMTMQEYIDSYEYINTYVEDGYVEDGYVGERIV